MGPGRPLVKDVEPMLGPNRPRLKGLPSMHGHPMVNLETQARAALRRLEGHRRELARLPQSPWRELEDFRVRLERLMAEYEGATLRQRKAFLRQLEDLAAAIDGSTKEGRWSPRHVRVVGIALRDARRLHFANAKNVLRKFDKPLGLYTAWGEATEEYRRLHRALNQDLEELRGRREALRAIPMPPMGPQESSAMVALVRDYNAQAAVFLRDVVARWPPKDALMITLDGSHKQSLRLPPPGEVEAAEALLGFLRESPALTKLLPSQGVRGLLEFARFTDAKLAHMGTGAMDLRRLVVESQGWLKAVLDCPGRALTLPWDGPISEAAVDGLGSFLRDMPGADGLRDSLSRISEALKSGALKRAREAEILYARHGEAARRRWEGSLGKEVEGLEGRISGVRTALESLPAPDAQALSR